MTFVIFGDIDLLTGEPLFWNNDTGWGSLLSATRFTEAESLTYKVLPLCSNRASIWVREH